MELICCFEVYFNLLTQELGGKTSDKNSAERWQVYENEKDYGGSSICCFDLNEFVCMDSVERPTT
jgi:hypothetical protein